MGEHIFTKGIDKMGIVKGAAVLAFDIKHDTSLDRHDVIYYEGNKEIHLGTEWDCPAGCWLTKAERFENGKRTEWAFVAKSDKLNEILHYAILEKLRGKPKDKFEPVYTLRDF